MSWLSSVAGAALGIWSGNKSANAQAALSREQMQWQSQEAQKTRDWQEKMSSTAHQREIEDLRKAGLNPMLSGMGGQGASTPAGATASYSSNAYTGYGSDVSNGINAMTGMYSAKTNRKIQHQQEKNLEQQNLNLSADTYKKTQEGRAASTEADYKKAMLETQLVQLLANANNLQASADFTKGVGTAKAQSEIDKYNAETRYISGPQTDVANATTANLGAQTNRINALLPHEIAKIDSDIEKNVHEILRIDSETSLNQVKMMTEKYVQGELSARSLVEYLQAKGQTEDNALKFVNRVRAQIDLKQYQTQNRYSGVTPQGPYERLARILGNAKGLVDASPFGLITQILK